MNLTSHYVNPGFFLPHGLRPEILQSYSRLISLAMEQSSEKASHEEVVHLLEQKVTY